MYKGEMAMLENLFFQKRTFILLIFCILSGLCFHYFFYGKTVGISVLLYTVLLYVLYFIQFPDLLKTQRKLSWFFLCAILLLSATFFIFINEMFRFFNVVILPLLMLYHTFLLKKGIRGEWAKPVMIARLGSAISDMFKIFFGSFSVIGIVLKKGMDEQKYETVKRVLLGVVISTPILFFVTFLLISSDENFSNMMLRIPLWFMDLSLGSVIFQGCLVLFVALALFSYLLSLRLETKLEEEVDQITNQPFDTIIVGTVLILINCVYSLYLVSQFSYFFGFNPATSDSYSFATYARKGFAELTIVSIINFSILLSVLHYTKLKNILSKVVIKGLLSLLVTFSSLILFSAFYRLSLYEAAYGFTYLRLLAHSFMILLFIMLIIAFVRIWMVKMPLLKAYVVLCVSYYVVLNYLNIDVIIAEQNINRYEKSGKLDLVYMEILSDDVIPYLVRLDISSEYIDMRKNQLTNGTHHWPEWNWSSHKASQYLLKTEGEH